MLFKQVNLAEMVMCLEDLINYFAQPEEDIGSPFSSDFIFLHPSRSPCSASLENLLDLFLFNGDQEPRILFKILEILAHSYSPWIVFILKESSKSFHMSQLTLQGSFGFL